MFNQAVRTNNDLEGWHGMLNRHANKANLSFYVLIQLLEEQSQLVDNQVGVWKENETASEERVQENRRETFCSMEAIHGC